MDVVKYEAQLEDLIGRIPAFLRDQLDEAKSSGRDAGRAARILQFSKDLSSLNNNPFVSGLFPFEILGNGAPLTDEQISGLISEARDYGLGDEVLLIKRGNIGTLFFSHAAEPYMPPLLKLLGLSCRNLDGNGLVMRNDHVFIGTLAKHEPKLEGLLARLPGFLKDQLDEAKSSGRDVGRAARSRQFAKDLSALNNDSSVSGLFPFAVIGDEEPLTDEQIEALVADADSRGLSAETMVINRSNFRVFVFSHAAEEGMSAIAKLRGLPYCNMEGNCLVMQGLHLIGLFSADPFTLRVFLKDAEAFIGGRQH